MKIYLFLALIFSFEGRILIAANTAPAPQCPQGTQPLMAPVSSVYFFRGEPKAGSFSINIKQTGLSMPYACGELNTCTCSLQSSATYCSQPLVQVSNIPATKDIPVPPVSFWEYYPGCGSYKSHIWDEGQDLLARDEMMDMFRQKCRDLCRETMAISVSCCAPTGTCNSANSVTPTESPSSTSISTMGDSYAWLTEDASLAGLCGSSANYRATVRAEIGLSAVPAGNVSFPESLWQPNSAEVSLLNQVKSTCQQSGGVPNEVPYACSSSVSTTKSGAPSYSGYFQCPRIVCCNPSSSQNITESPTNSGSVPSYAPTQMQ